MSLRRDTVCGGGVRQGTMPLVQLSAGFQSLPQLPTSKLGSSGADSQVGGFVYILGPCRSLQWTVLWSWEFSLSGSTPTDVFSQRFWGFISLHWNPGLRGLSHSSVVPPGLSARECGTGWSASRRLAMHPLCPGCLSLPLLTSLNECFFNSFVVGLPYSLIFWQFWLFFVFKFLVILLLVVCGGQVYLPTPPPWPEVNVPFS